MSKAPEVSGGPRRLDARGIPPREALRSLRRPDGYLSDKVREASRSIVADVRDRGDAALQEYTERFDGVRPDPIRVPDEEIARARKELPGELEESLRVAIENVRAFHERELSTSGWAMSLDGAVVGQKVRPVGRAGIYVPGGHGSYPSTLVMSAVPARVAGVGEISVCVPPGPDGKVDDTVLAVADMLGIGEVYAVGGAQAVGAMAYGTDTVPAVDKIVGPGNDYVIAAKLEVFGVCGVDAPKGPSELVVIADENADPEETSLDLMAQAEHLSGASTVLVTPSAELIDAVEPRLSGEPSDWITLVLVADLDAAVGLTDLYAPEHAHVLTADADGVAGRITKAGMVAVGRWSPVALGDYAAGPSHALPTGGAAAYSSAISTHEFLVRTNYIRHDRGSVSRLGPHVERLARLEGFTNHAESVAVRVRESETREEEADDT
ncbi:histidinol dehydrogenase [Rubrobacter aplysinae]|uniref:histidinol dehydrogenase n=1 Tax=Rubrobacter aplysinae TaxID=909625 RepID=UPI00069F6FBA|nr:histidinol dehydrogenase [Rubrobacter aplysinae]